MSKIEERENLTVRTRNCRYCSGSTSDWWRQFCCCMECGLIYRDPMPTDAELESLYNDSWDQPDTKVAETGSLGVNVTPGFITSIKRNVGVESLEGLTIVDFGAGKGDMLSALREAGANAIGVEPFGFEYLQENGFEVYRELSDIPESLKIDGVFSSNVVEHLTDPRDAIASIYSRLASNGWFFVTTPNAMGAHARLRKGNWREAMKAGHLVFFSHKSMIYHLQDAGFRSVRVAAGHVSYDKGAWRDILHRLLGQLGLEGEIKYIGFK